MTKRVRKNYLPAIFFAILSWAMFLFFLIFVDPSIVANFLIPGSYLPFFLALFFSLFLTGSFMFLNARRGLWLAGGVVIFLYLRLWGLGHLLNLVLLAAFFLILEMALSGRS